MGAGAIWMILTVLIMSSDVVDDGVLKYYEQN